MRTALTLAASAALLVLPAAQARHARPATLSPNVIGTVLYVHATFTRLTPGTRYTARITSFPAGGGDGLGLASYQASVLAPPSGTVTIQSPYWPLRGSPGQRIAFYEAALYASSPTGFPPYQPVQDASGNDYCVQFTADWNAPVTDCEFFA